LGKRNAGGSTSSVDDATALPVIPNVPLDVTTSSVSSFTLGKRSLGLCDDMIPLFWTLLLLLLLVVLRIPVVLLVA
jgi:hypothetical protein